MLLYWMWLRAFALKNMFYAWNDITKSSFVSSRPCWLSLPESDAVFRGKVHWRLDREDWTGGGEFSLNFAIFFSIQDVKDSKYKNTIVEGNKDMWVSNILLEIKSHNPCQSTAGAALPLLPETDSIFGQKCDIKLVGQIEWQWLFIY